MLVLIVEIYVYLVPFVVWKEGWHLAFVWACDSDAVQDNGVFNIGKLKLSVWLFKMYLFFSQCQGNIDIANSNTLLLSIY